MPSNKKTSSGKSSGEIPDWLHWVESCGSTNTWAMEHGKQLRHGDTVFTQQQTAGRGQRGRVWYAPPGVITASFVLDNVSMDQRSGLSLAVGLGVIYAVEDLIPELAGKLKLKWPNDVLIQGRKVAGVLCESVQAVLAPRNRVIVGIGLNRCAQFEPNLDSSIFKGNSAQPSFGQDVPPISLHQVSVTVPEELLLLERLRHYLLQVAGLLGSDWFSEPSGLERLLPHIHTLDMLLGREVALEREDQVIQGRAVGINAEGQLLLRLSNSELVAFSSGRVRWN
jgi:BirA family transcriptional regulator, biotin operon repressor / biotin---[acetyl-CoA-carboxylase] ligase